VSIYLGNLEPGARYRVTDDGRPVKTKSAGTIQILQGSCCFCNVPHQNYKTNVTEIFLPGCWGDTLFGVLFLRDHKLAEKAIGNQDDGTLELVDTDIGLAFRLQGDLEKLESRDELSVGYHVLDATIRSDGIRLIKSAILIEVSACHVGAVRQTWSEIRDVDTVGKLADEAKHLVGEGAAKGFLRALRGLE
jgi:hypothetical protein